MKSTVEQLSPTRVRINVEVPFTELKPDFDRAYKQLAQQVRLPGFRPGKAPAKLLEARIGRGAVLEQVVNDALPSRYSEAVWLPPRRVVILLVPGAWCCCAGVSDIAGALSGRPLRTRDHRCTATRPGTAAADSRPAQGGRTPPLW